LAQIVTAAQRRNYYFIIGLVVMMQITASTIYMVLPLFYASVGVSVAENGVLISIGTFMGILSGLTAGVLSNRFGRKKILTLSAIIYSVSYFMLGYMGTDFGSLALSRLVAGMGFYMMPVMVTTMAADIFPAGIRGRAMSLYQATSGVGSLIGPLIVPLLIFGTDFSHYFLFATISIMISGVLMAFIIKETLPSELKSSVNESFRKKLNVRGFLTSVKGLGLVVGIFLGAVILYRTAYTMIDPFLSLYLTQVLKLNLDSVSVIYASRAVCYIAFSFVGGYLIDRFSKKTVLLLGLAMTTITIISYPFTLTFPLMLVLRAWDAASTAILITGIYTSLADLLTVEKRGLGMGIYSATAQQSSTVGSIFSGFLIGAYGFNFVFVTAGIACALSFLIFWRFVPGEKREDKSSK